MIKKNDYNNNGFTIIEVLIVLAIAALILVVVLLAIPQLQRNVRNHHRKKLAEIFMAQLIDYQSVNNGKFPGAQFPRDFNLTPEHDAGNAFSDKFIANNPEFVDPLGGDPLKINWGTSISGLGHIDWVFGAWCDGDVFDSNSNFNTDRTKIAVMIGVEPGDLDSEDPGEPSFDPTWQTGRPQDATYCVDNSE